MRSSQALRRLLIWSVVLEKSSDAFSPTTRSAWATHKISPRRHLLKEACVAGRASSTGLRRREWIGIPTAAPSRLAASQGEAASSSPTSSTASSMSSKSHGLRTQHEEELDQLLERGQLGEAAHYLRQHADHIEMTRERWNFIFSVIEEQTAHAEENSVNMRQVMNAATEFPAQSRIRQGMTDMYETLYQLGHLTLFRAISTVSPPAAGSHTLSPALLEKILGLKMKALTPQPTNSLLIAGMVLALTEGMGSTLTGINFNALVLLTILLAFFDRLFANGAVFESFLKLFNPGIQTKILRHEAGHFLAAYLLGCPVEGIVLSAWAALQDERFGARQVSAGTSFFDPDLSLQINSRGQVTRSSIDRYSMIVMAGIAAEADYYGRADGGAGDEMALVAFLRQLNGRSMIMSSSSGGGGGGASRMRNMDVWTSRPLGVWNGDSIRNQARWGALQAVLMLRAYKPAYEALVDALERGGNLGDCIYAIERAARENQLTPLQRPLGYIRDFGPELWTLEPSVNQTSLDWSQPLRTTSSTMSSLSRVLADDQETSSPAVLMENLRNPLTVPVMAPAPPEVAKPIPAPSMPPVIFDEEQSLAALKEYRAAMEARLRDIDAKLKEIK